MRNKPNKGNQVKDEDLEKTAGGSVSKLIFADGSVEYRANSSVYDHGGYNLPPIGYGNNQFNNREDAEKYAIKQGWGTDFHTFRQHGHPFDDFFWIEE